MFVKNLILIICIKCFKLKSFTSLFILIWCDSFFEKIKWLPKMKCRYLIVLRRMNSMSNHASAYICIKSWSSPHCDHVTKRMPSPSSARVVISSPSYDADFSLRLPSTHDQTLRDLTLMNIKIQCFSWAVESRRSVCVEILNDNPN